MKIRIENTPEYLESIISKEELKKLYVDKRINKITIAKQIGVCESTLNKIIKHYGLIKEKKIKPINNINKEDFINYYKSHNIYLTAEYYNTSTQNISKYCKEIGYIKDKFQEAIEKVSKEDLYQYYIVEDHGYEETAKHFGISTWNLDKLKNYYGVKKYDKCKE